MIKRTSQKLNKNNTHKNNKKEEFEGNIEYYRILMCQTYYYNIYISSLDFIRNEQLNQTRSTYFLHVFIIIRKYYNIRID